MTIRRFPAVPSFKYNSFSGIIPCSYQGRRPLSSTLRLSFVLSQHILLYAIYINGTFIRRQPCKYIRIKHWTIGYIHPVPNFHAVHKIILKSVANHRPRHAGNKPGLRNFVSLIPFPHSPSNYKYLSNTYGALEPVTTLFSVFLLFH